MIVVDASVVVCGLLNDGAARELMGTERLNAPYLIDTEAASALRRQVLAGTLSGDQGWTALDTWRRMAVRRYPAHAMLDRVWELRHNVSAYEATYLALAELLGCPLVTLDGRLTRGSGDRRCPVTVLPS